MESDLADNLSVPLSTIFDAEGIIYMTAIRLLDDIYRSRNEGREIADYVLRDAEKTTRICLELRKAQSGGEYPYSDLFMQRMKEIENVGLNEHVMRDQIRELRAEGVDIDVEPIRTILGGVNYGLFQMAGPEKAMCIYKHRIIVGWKRFLPSNAHYLDSRAEKLKTLEDEVDRYIN